MAAAPEGLEKLLALEDIRLLRAKYCQYVDGHQFGRLDEVLAEDAVLDLSPVRTVLGGGDIDPIAGKDEIIHHLRHSHFATARQLVHITTIPIIEFHDGEHATGTWRQETYVNESRTDPIGTTGIAYATATDTYRKDGSRWWIASVRVEIDVVI